MISNRPGPTLLFPIVDCTGQMINVRFILLSELDEYEAFSQSPDLYYLVFQNGVPKRSIILPDNHRVHLTARVDPGECVSLVSECRSMSPDFSPAPATAGAQDRKKRQVRAEQIHLLYANGGTGTWVTLAVASVLSYVQWTVIPHHIVLSWLAYMMIVSSARFTLARLYWRTSPDRRGSGWGAAFSIGAGLSGTGWGVASFLLYPEASLTNQVFLAFVLGGIMLGAISLLSSRPEAFLAFTIPTGLPAAVRFLAQSDPVHFTMGLLAALFTINILITTWQIYRTVSLTLNLRFENRELLENLQTAKAEAEALNQKLESRVEERTFELYNANNRLRAEIEQRKLAEDELLRARKLESLGVLAGGIAHDFNNFLTIVQGNAALAKLKLESGDPVDDTLEQIASACQRAASLASQLLTFGKGGAPVRRLVSTSRLIEEAVGLARAGANVSIDVAIEDNLWSAEVDASQISHALHNILLNARQAMPEGGLIEVRGENLIAEADSPLLSPGQYVRIAVRDYGCGIPSDTLPRVFDPYFTTKQNGAGLGLAAAYSIVAKHQGQITVQSKLGEGTTFCVYLPASERSPSAEPQTSRKLHSGSGRVLVMDDEESLRGLVTRVLEQLGYQVESANDGAGAIALYEAARASGRGFDAVLLDLTVPGGMGGVDAAAKLREIDPSVPLIVSSGYSEAPILSEFQTHGFDAVLRKPWTPAELSEVVKQVIQTGRQHTND